MATRYFITEFDTRVMRRLINSDIMDIKGLADYLHIHPATVYKYARLGKIPAFKIGYDWRFHKKLIDKWIQDKVKYNMHRNNKGRSEM